MVELRKDISPMRMLNISKRESQVLTLLCQGKTCNEIAKEIFLSPHTIDSHKKNLKRKFKAKNIVHLGVLAERHGFLKDLQI